MLNTDNESRNLLKREKRVKGTFTTDEWSLKQQGYNDEKEVIIRYRTD